MGSGVLDYSMLILATEKVYVVSGAARSLPDNFELSIGDIKKLALRVCVSPF